MARADDRRIFHVGDRRDTGGERLDDQGGPSESPGKSEGIHQYYIKVRAYVVTFI